jgi:hypothetical protein
MSTSDCSIITSLPRRIARNASASNYFAYFTYSEMRMSSATSSHEPSRSLKNSSVLFVFPRLTAAMNRFASIKYLVLLPGKLIGLFFDLSFKLIQINVFGSLEYLIQHGF